MTSYDVTGTHMLTAAAPMPQFPGSKSHTVVGPEELMFATNNRGKCKQRRQADSRYKQAPTSVPVCWANYLDTHGCSSRRYAPRLLADRRLCKRRREVQRQTVSVSRSTTISARSPSPQVTSFPLIHIMNTKRKNAIFFEWTRHGCVAGDWSTWNLLGGSVAALLRLVDIRYSSLYA